MEDRAALLALIKKHAVVHGDVTLSSGRQADYYIDLRRVTLSGEAAPLVRRRLPCAKLWADSVGRPRRR